VQGRFVYRSIVNIVFIQSTRNLRKDFNSSKIFLSNLQICQKKWIQTLFNYLTSIIISII